MIRINKDRLTVGGEIEVLMAEFMCIAAYMIETFGIEETMCMVGIALNETEGEE